jgi:uncharacterized protein YgiM (DUF1202 family)
VLIVVAIKHMTTPEILTGPAFVDHTAKLNLRDGPSANAHVIIQLSEGDAVLVTASYNNGWKAVTIRYNDDTTTVGFVNGAYLRWK